MGYDRLLEPGDPVLGVCGAPAQRLDDVEHLVGIDHDRDIGADLRYDRGDPCHILFERGGADLHLHATEPVLKGAARTAGGVLRGRS